MNAMPTLLSLPGPYFVQLVVEAWSRLRSVFATDAELLHDLRRLDDRTLRDIGLEHLIALRRP